MGVGGDLGGHLQVPHVVRLPCPGAVRKLTRCGREGRRELAKRFLCVKEGDWEKRTTIDKEHYQISLYFLSHSILLLYSHSFVCCDMDC